MDCTFFAGSRQDGMQFSCFVLLSLFFLSYFVQLLQPWLITVAWTVYYLQNLSYEDYVGHIFSFFIILHLPLVFKKRELAKLEAFESIFVGAFYPVPFFHHFSHALNKSIDPFAARAGNQVIRQVIRTSFGTQFLSLFAL